MQRLSAAFQPFPATQRMQAPQTGKETEPGESRAKSKRKYGRATAPGFENEEQRSSKEGEPEPGWELRTGAPCRAAFKLQGNDTPTTHPNQNKKPNLAKGNTSTVKPGYSIPQLPAPLSCSHPARTPTVLTTYLGGTNSGAAQHHIHLLHARAGPGEPTAMLNTWVPCLVTGVLLIETQLTPNLLSAS